MLEILVSVTALLTVLARVYVPADSWGSFPYSLSDGIWVQNGIYRFSQVIIAAACVFIPCLFMGMTFPLICSAFRPGSEWRSIPGGALCLEHARCLYRRAGVSILSVAVGRAHDDLLGNGL